MTREEIVQLAESLGWKQWGKMRRRPYNGSMYQCFRRGNHYAWIGNYYVETSLSEWALGFPESTKEEMLLFIKEGKYPESH